MNTGSQHYNLHFLLRDFQRTFSLFPIATIVLFIASVLVVPFVSITIAIVLGGVAFGRCVIIARTARTFVVTRGGGGGGSQLLAAVEAINAMYVVQIISSFLILTFPVATFVFISTASIISTTNTTRISIIAVFVITIARGDIAGVVESKLIRISLEQKTKCT